MTGTGAFFGAAVGGAITGGTPPGYIIGGFAGGAAGFALAQYFNKENLNITFRENYDAWKAKVKDKACYDELEKISQEHPLFENCKDSVTDELFQIPFKILKCGHTVERKSLDKIIEKSRKNSLEPTCPLCRTEFTENDLEKDIAMDAKMKKIYGILANDVSQNGKYSKEVLNAFEALAKDTERHIENEFIEATTKILQLYHTKKISFDVYKRWSREIEKQFDPYLQ